MAKAPDLSFFFSGEAWCVALLSVDQPQYGTLTIIEELGSEKNSS
jgi:hypothetical protein